MGLFANSLFAAFAPPKTPGITRDVHGNPVAVRRRKSNLIPVPGLPDVKRDLGNPSPQTLPWQPYASGQYVGSEVDVIDITGDAPAEVALAVRVKRGKVVPAYQLKEIGGAGQVFVVSANFFKPDGLPVNVLYSDSQAAPTVTNWGPDPATLEQIAGAQFMMPPRQVLVDTENPGGPFPFFTGPVFCLPTEWLEG